jgi:hypothetical protein
VILKEEMAATLAFDWRLLLAAVILSEAPPQTFPLKPQRREVEGSPGV